MEANQRYTEQPQRKPHKKPFVLKAGLGVVTVFFFIRRRR